MKYRPEYSLEVIGNNLKRLRIANGYSVEQVRKYLCLGSVQAIYKYEKGKSYPQADTMFALMQLYNARLEDIIYGSYDMAAFENEHDNHYESSASLHSAAHYEVDAA